MAKRNISGVDWAVYYLFCILSLGTVYLCRIVITIGVEMAND